MVRPVDTFAAAGRGAPERTHHHLAADEALESFGVFVFESAPLL